MVLRHTFYYLFARGLPGLVNFAALALYTRLLAPDDFGRYSLVIAAIGLVDVMVFQWLRLVLGRLISAQDSNPQSVLDSVLALYLALAGVIIFIGGGAALILSDTVSRGLLSVGISLTLTQAWLQMDLTLASAKLEPSRYGRLLGTKSLLALLVGGWLAWIGFGAYGPLLGLVVGSAVAWLLFGLAAWKGVRPHWPPYKQFRNFSAYGLPLAATFALGWVISSSDRVIISWLLGEAAAGVYAVGYDLPQQTLGLILTIINTAAYPLAINRFEQEGAESASTQVRTNGDFIITSACTGAAALIALAPQLVDLIVGAAFREGALEVLPWVAASAAVAGIKAFHFDIAFHLMCKSRSLVLTSGLAAFSNIGLNFLWIPEYGISGAAWATFASLLIASIASSIFSRRVFSMPSPYPLLAKGLISAGAMYAGVKIVLLYQLHPLSTILIGAGLGTLFAFATALMLDVGGMRSIARLRFLNSNKPR